jgi:hypothetical protein
MAFTSETLPADHKAAIRQMKQAARAIGDVQAVFDKLSDITRVDEIDALKAQAVWPTIRSRYAEGK